MRIIPIFGIDISYTDFRLLALTICWLLVYFNHVLGSIQDVFMEWRHGWGCFLIYHKVPSPDGNGPCVTSCLSTRELTRPGAIFIV